MQSPYFCAFHARNIQMNENEAMSSWISLMRRATKAFSDCRVDAARIYFEASLDVGLLRIEQPNNQFFGLTQILKPTDFLMDIYLYDDSFTEAYATLGKISDQLSDCFSHADQTTQEILRPYYYALETLEKDKCSETTHAKRIQRSPYPTGQPKPQTANHFLPDQPNRFLFERLENTLESAMH